MNDLRKIGLLGIFLGMWAFAFSQPMVFTHLSSKDSLLQNSAYSIQQDGHGFMWFATQVSVEVYDGHKFRHIEYEREEENFLCETPVLCPDSSRNRVWLGTNLGLGWIDKQNLELHLLETSPAPEDIDVRVLTPDPASGDIWVGTSCSVYRMQLEGEELPIFTKVFPEGDVCVGGIREVLPMKNGELYIAADSGVYSLASPGTLAASSRMIKAGKASLLQLDGQHIWAAFRGEGLFDLTLGNGCVPIDTSGDINCLVRNGEGLWIGTENQGLKMVSLSQEHWGCPLPNATASLMEQPIRSLYQSREGVIWVGTRGNGIFFWSPMRPRFEHYFRREDIAEDRTRILWAIRTDLNDPRKIWLGTDGDGLAAFHLDRLAEPEYFTVVEPGATPHPRAQKVRCITRDGDKMWLGTRRGLFQYDPDSHIFSIPSGSEVFSPARAIIISLWRDPHNPFLWVGTESNGLFVLNIDTGEWQQLLHPDSYPTVGEFTISFIGKGAEKGTVFVGSSYGFFQFDAHSFTLLPNAEGELLSLPATYIRSVLIKNPGDSLLWIGTNMKGLIRYNRVTGESRTYSTKDGLPNKVIYGMLLDRDGDVWLSTNVGIARFDPAKEIFINYGKSDGIQDYEFNTGAYHAEGDSILYFGGVNGFNRIQWRKSKASTKMELGLFALIGYEHWEEERLFFDGDSLELPSNYEYVKFRMAALEFHDPEKHHFCYRIQREGEALPWKNTLTWPKITMGKKDYGDWLLDFRASDSFGTDWHTGTLKVKIESPVFLKWWVLLPLSFLLLTGLLLGGGEYVRRRRLAELEKSHRENLEFLREMGSQLTFPAHRDILVERLREKVREMVKRDVFKSDLFLLGIKHPDTGKMEYQILTEEVPAHSNRLDLETETQLVATTHLPLPVETRKQKLFPEGPWVLTRPLVLNEGFENEKRLGIAAIVSREAESYTDNDRQVFGALGDYLAIALDNAQKINAEYSHEMARSLQQALRSSLTEHFTKNLLAKAQGFVFRDDKKALLSFLSRMGKMIETAMRHSEKGLVTIREEIEYLQLYLELQQANLGPDRLQFAIEGGDHPGISTLKIPSMVVQTYVENAILHGVAGLPSAATGKVTVRWKFPTEPGENSSCEGPDRYCCIIEDNGMGFGASPSSHFKKQVHGMTLTRERLDLLSAINDFDMTPRVESVQEDTPRGTRVILSFPLEVSVDLEQASTFNTPNEPNHG